MLGVWVRICRRRGLRKQGFGPIAGGGESVESHESTGTAAELCYLGAGAVDDGVRGNFNRRVWSRACRFRGVLGWMSGGCNSVAIARDSCNGTGGESVLNSSCIR